MWIVCLECERPFAATAHPDAAPDICFPCWCAHDNRQKLNAYLNTIEVAAEPIRTNTEDQEPDIIKSLRSAAQKK